MNNRLRSLSLFGCTLVLTLVTACAQARNSYIGRWVGMTQGDLFKIKGTGTDQYLATTSQGFPIYLTEHDGRLAGTVLHVATARVTIRFDHGFNHILVVLPDGTRQVYKRATQK